MTGKDNADANLSEMEGEDSVRTVNCLRVRLLAERVASRTARQEADQLGKKLLELESLLKEEAKSRNRAEKRLKFLMKRLQSINTSDISSASSIASSSTKQPEKGEKNLSTVSESQESKENVKSSKGDIAYRSIGCLNQEDSHDPDNSMALVPVDVPQKNETIDPEVLDATVKEVLGALRRAKEQLQSSMERRRTSMIKVG